MPRIYIAGHRGMVGSALYRTANSRGYHDIITRTHKQLDLLDPQAVDDFLKVEKPDWVFLAAAKVGGIYANNTYRADFLLENLKIQNNIIESAFKNDVSKLLFLGSSCIYPKNAPQPIKETDLLTSALEPTNEPYAIAKIAGIKLCGAFNDQYGTNYISVMPSNLYGIGDNYHPENAHVLPMLLRRFHEAKTNKDSVVSVWGTGKPRREFLFADDMAEACFYLMEQYDTADIGELINVGTGEDISIKDLASLVKKVVGFEGDIVFDTTKQDGTMQKRMDISRLDKLGWRFKTGLEDGIRKTYDDFLNNPDIRK
ncbi:GDP-L-fucose synthase [bacterium BMS3Bbin11]|nr:GDP-L-fucose synthase [bacterium BMS3Abin11]GBE46742.1 GDP-L-fucose synthase [bacterium BMS3Bbin11]GMT40889.1 MAG: GDP-L-fucose synthase [bacterium]HDH15692.1 GDP-L-fucose synthase [Gammaproteobacteria bacterium]HDZ78295.1 GDP-L-fucose synthase [Gammaproteobacteria bacterium]